MKKLEKWKTSKLAMHCRLAKRGFFESMSIFLAMLVASIVVYRLEFLINGTSVSLIPMGVLSVVFFLWGLGVPGTEIDLFTKYRRCIESGNDRCRDKINPKRWTCLIGGLGCSEKTRMGLLLCIRLVVGMLVFSVFCCFLNDYIERLWLSIVMLLGYAVAYILVGLWCRKRTSRILKLMKTVISIPWRAFCLLFYALMPFIVVMGTCLFLAVFTFGLPALLLEEVSRSGWVTFQRGTIVFVVFTIGSIVCSCFYGLTKWIIRCTPLRDFGNHASEAYRVQLAISLIHPSNVMFLLYLLYVVLLGISGYLQFEKGGYLMSPEMDAAILKAFVVFIAFTNMRVKAKAVKLDVKKLYRQTLKLFVEVQ